MVEYIVAIDVTRVRFPADALLRTLRGVCVFVFVCVLKLLAKAFGMKE